MAARSRLSATARIDLPARVRARKKATAGAVTAVIAIATAWPGREADEAEVEDGGLVDVELADLRAGDDEDDVADHQRRGRR